MRILVRRADGTVLGPMEEGAAAAMLASGQLLPTDKLQDFDTGMPAKLQPKGAPAPPAAKSNTFQRKAESVFKRDDGTAEMWGAIVFSVLASALMVIFLSSHSSLFPALLSCTVVAGIYAYRCQDKNPDLGPIAIGFTVASFAVFLGCSWFAAHRTATISTRLVPAKGVAGTKASSTVAAHTPQSRAPVIITHQSSDGFDWNSLPDTGGDAYAALEPAQFDPSDHSSDNTIIRKYPLDSPNRPVKNEDGSDPQVETDDQGKQWAVYTSHSPASSSVAIQSIRLHPSTIGNRHYLIGEITVANLSPYNVIGLQIGYVSGDLKTTILTADKAAAMTKGSIAPQTGLGLQIKSYAPDQDDKTVPSLLLEAQIDGPPGLLTDQEELTEALISSDGQVINP